MSGDKLLEEQGTALGALQIFSPFEASTELKVEEKPQVEETEDPKPPKKEEEPEKVQDSKLKDEKVDPPSTDFSSYSVPSRLALSIKNTHGYIPDDTEIKEDMSFEQLFEMVDETAQLRIEKKTEGLYEKRKAEITQKLRDEGLDLNAARQNAHLANGGSPQVVSAYHQYKALADHTPDTDEQKEEIIRANLLAQGQRKDLVNHHIENIRDEEDLDAELRKAQEELASVADGILKNDEQKVSEEKDRMANLRKEAHNEILSAIKSTDLPFKIPKGEYEDFADYLTKFDKVVQGADGVRRELTGFQETMQKVFSDRDELILWGGIGRIGVRTFIDLVNKGAGEKFIASLEDEDISKTITADEIDNPKPRAGREDRYLDNLEKLQQSGELLGIL